LKAFVDTSFWIAYIDKTDEHYIDAAEFLPLAMTIYDMVTSNFIIYETITYLNCSLKSHSTALSFLDIIEKACENKDISVIKVDNRLQNEALDIFRRYKDKDFSFTDCTSAERRKFLTSYFLLI